MENVSNGENEKSLEILGAEALAELDDETRTHAVTFIASYLNRIYGNCIWVGVLYLARMFSKSDKKRGDNQFDLFEFIADVIQLFAFLFFPLQNLHYWGILKETYQETRIGEVINFGRAHKVAIVYTVSFFIAVVAIGIPALLHGVFNVTFNNNTIDELWTITQYSFCFSVAVLLWSFFVAYANRSAFKKIVECYGDEELIDIVEEQYSIRNALFTRETLLSKLR